MTEYIEIFELVLYYSRRTIAEPFIPSFEEIKKKNPDKDTDELLDILSDFKKDYKKNLSKYEKTKDSSSIISDHVRIVEDENFIENVKKFEKNSFFVEWEKVSKKKIDETIMKLSKY